MKIKIVAVGEIKEAFWKSAIKEYLKRLSPYSKVDIIEVQDERCPEQSSLALETITKNKEGQKILSHIKQNEFVVALDLNKGECDSVTLSRRLEDMFIKGRSSITFVIGGSLGLSEEIRNRCNDFITLSKLTFTHQMCRVILLEQIYRSFKIMNNEKYHK